MFLIEGSRKKILSLIDWKMIKGASAGAGSGEFDIYRVCRRREQIRQEYLQEQADKVEWSESYINNSKIDILIDRFCLFRKKHVMNLKPNVWLIWEQPKKKQPKREQKDSKVN